MRSAIRVVVPALALFIATASTVHAQCDLACPKSLPVSVTPKAATTYTYSLLSKTHLSLSTGQKISLKADAELAVADVCKSYLSLKNVVVEGVPDAADLATKLSANPVAFGYHNGRLVGGEACAVAGEEDWALNIKLATLSALQVSSTGPESTELVESDFSGKCKTSYSVVSSGPEKTVVKKEKELNRCSERRVDLRQSSDMALGQFKELVRQYVHPLHSKSSCTVTLNKDKVVALAECTEESHLPMSSGPIHVSELKLELKSSKDGIDAALAGKTFAKKPAHLSYNHKHEHVSNEADVVVVLKKLCSEISGPNTQIEASNTFDDLVGKLRYIPEDAAASVDEALKSGTICPAAPKRLREVFLDAAAFAASDASIKVLVKAHSNKELSVSRTTAAFTVVALRAAPNGNTIKALLPLVNADEAPRPLVLGLSVLTRRYCQKTNDCDKNPSVKEARDAYLAKLAKTTDKLQKLTLIKALENLNVATEGNEALVKALEEIVNNEGAGVAARVAAVKAMPDEASLNDPLKAIVLKESNPNEVRIAAFQKLAHNAGLKNVKDFFGAQEHCVKNYVLSYVKNLKESKNPVRRSLVPEDLTLPEEPNKKFGITKNLMMEYGPVALEMDIIYPMNKNVTSAINVRVTRVSDNKVHDVFEVALYQEGLDPNVGNVLNLLARKVSPAEFSFQALKHLSETIKKFRTAGHVHNTLQATWKLNGKNVILSDVFEDLHSLMDLAKKRLNKIMDDKAVDLTIAGVLVDSKVVVPTVSGIPIMYKIDDNVVTNINGKVKDDGGKKNVVLNRSLVGSLKASAKMLLADNKIGYDYDARMALTPTMDLDFEKRDKGALVRLNLPDGVEKHTLFKLKQSLKEVKKGAAKDQNTENELAVEPRSESCFAPLILNYCRKSSTVTGLILPNVELYVSKPDKNLKAIEFELSKETPVPDNRKYAIKVRGVGAAGDTEHVAQIEVAYPKDGKKEAKLSLKSPTNKFETTFSLNLDATKNVDVKLDLPHVVDINLKGKMGSNKDTGERSTDLKVEYKFPDDPTVHTLTYNAKGLFSFKRSNKEKVASADFQSEFTSSRRPFLNHKTNFVLRYRPLKLQQLTIDFSHGANNDNKFRLHRLTNINVKEMKPFSMNADSEIQLVSTLFDVNYDLKTTAGLVSSPKGMPAEMDLTVKGKDLSKRAAAENSIDIDGEIKYRNKGADKLDQTIQGKLKFGAKEMAYDSELKQTEPNKYEGKITVQTEKDKKIMMSHKIEATKPTKDLMIKIEVDTTYSWKPEKKQAKFEIKRANNVFSVTGEETRDGTVFLKNDMKLENYKLKWTLTRDYRSYDLDVDNVLKPRQASLVLKVRDRVYNFKLERQPLKFLNLKIEGNDKALVQKGDAHISLIDPITFNLLTKANTDIKLFIDALSSDKKATLKINMPKLAAAHDGELRASITGRRIQWKANTKYGDYDDKFNADLAPKGSLITWDAKIGNDKRSVKYSRNGDQIKLDIDLDNDISLQGDRKAGKIVIKGKDGGFTLESNYKIENGRLVIDSVTNNNAKLEALIVFDGRKEPSKLIFESPTVKTHLNLDFTKPLKKLDFDYDSPRYDRKVTGEMELGQSFKYISKGTSKATKKAYNFEVVGVPRKQLNLFLDYPEIKLKVERPPTGDKVKFTYTLNDYTESEEYPFNPHQSLVISWISVLRKYAQSFLVD